MTNKKVFIKQSDSLPVGAVEEIETYIKELPTENPIHLVDSECEADEDTEEFHDFFENHATSSDRFSPPDSPYLRCVWECIRNGDGKLECMEICR